MQQTVEAIYENGVLRPLEQLSLRPKQRVFFYAGGALHPLQPLLRRERQSN